MPINRFIFFAYNSQTLASKSTCLKRNLKIYRLFGVRSRRNGFNYNWRYCVIRVKPVRDKPMSPRGLTVVIILLIAATDASRTNDTRSATLSAVERPTRNVPGAALSEKLEINSFWKPHFTCKYSQNLLSFLFIGHTLKRVIRRCIEVQNNCNIYTTSYELQSQVNIDIFLVFFGP